MDREADIDIPNRLWSAWAPKVGKRAIIRAFTDHERLVLESRKALLIGGLRPMGNGEPLSAYSEAEWPSDVLIASAALSGMLGGFRPFRERGEGLKHLVRILLHVLRKFPAWAIIEACDKITAREVPDLNLDWPPSDTRIHAIVSEIVDPLQAQLVKTEALLEAPIELPPAPKQLPAIPDPTPAERQQMMAALIARGDPPDPSPSEKPGYMNRVLADIATRKKSREDA